MKLSATASNTPFEAHPEYDGQAVCVDVTPLKKSMSTYGERETFRLVFETRELRQDGKPYLVFSRGFTPSLHEKAALRAFLKQWFGRDLTTAEQNEFDTESLVGRPARVSVGVGSAGSTHGIGGGGCGKSGLVEGSPRWIVSVQEFVMGTVTEASTRIGRTALRGGGTGGVNGGTSKEPGMNVRAVAVTLCAVRSGAASLPVSETTGSSLAGDSG